MARRTRPTARMWQVWMKSAATDGLYWLHYATPTYKLAAEEYVRQREDYMMAELRTPLGHPVASHDKARIDEPSTDISFVWGVFGEVVPTV